MTATRISDYREGSDSEVLTVDDLPQGHFTGKVGAGPVGLYFKTQKDSNLATYIGSLPVGASEHKEYVGRVWMAGSAVEFYKAVQEIKIGLE